eukprot:scaffold22726_cov177-Cylindrotheca_fusiformis.AAC.3
MRGHQKKKPPLFAGVGRRIERRRIEGEEGPLGDTGTAKTLVDPKDEWGEQQRPPWRPLVLKVKGRSNHGKASGAVKDAKTDRPRRSEPKEVRAERPG